MTRAVRLSWLASIFVLASVAAGLPARVSAQAPVHVHAISVPSGVWLHQRVGSEWTDLCMAPCATEVVPGLELGLSLEGLSPQAVAAPTPSDGAVLRLRYDDRHLTRTYGLIVTVIGVLGALTLGLGGTVAWVAADGLGDMTGPVTAMLSGAGVLALGLSVGIVLLNEGDHLEITLGP